MRRELRLALAVGVILFTSLGSFDLEARRKDRPTQPPPEPPSQYSVILSAPSADIPAGCLTSSGNAATQIMTAMCNRVVACFPTLTTCQACQNGILATKQLGDEFGVSWVAENTLTWAEITTSVDFGFIIANQEVLTKCLAEIHSLQCSAEPPWYNPYNPTSFEGIEEMIDEGSVCEGVFSFLFQGLGLPW